MEWTKLKVKTGSFTFDSQNDSDTFYFRVPKINNPDVTKHDAQLNEDYICANPEDYLVTVPETRGNDANTVGGGNIKQWFGDFPWDSNITFSTYLTYAEVTDMIAAKSEGVSWTLSDVHDVDYDVTFDFKEGFVIENRVKGNDRFFCKFKFRRET